MKLQFCKEPLDQVAQRCLVVLATRDGKTFGGGVAGELLAPFVASGEFGRDFGVILYLVKPQGLAVERLLVLNLGKSADSDDDLRKGAARAWKELRKRGYDEALYSCEGLEQPGQIRAIVEGFQLGAYQMTQFKSDKEKLKPELTRLHLHGADAHAAQIERWVAVAEGTCRARDLCLLPPNELNPISFAEKAVAWGAEFGFETKILDKAAIAAERMNAILAVAQGSVLEPRLCLLDYQPDTPSVKTIVLVGKAVTFDSGGLNLKLAALPEMKGDMGGGAAVLGIMSVLRAIRYPHRVVGLIPAVENMLSGSATRPSDIVTSRAGITIEINNTDAEGRLILVDALAYAAAYQPDYVVDFATLTGACMVALGPKIYGVMGNHQPLVDAIVKAGWEVHEPFWQLPLFDGYKELLDSDLADISNLPSTRYGGAITAGLFLERWARDYKWAHCDIAAAITEHEDEYAPANGAGAGVRMMVEVLDRVESLA